MAGGRPTLPPAITYIIPGCRMGRFALLPPATAVTSPQEAEPVLRALADKTVLAFDTETTGLVRAKDRAVILSLSSGEDRYAIWPQALWCFKDLLENPEVKLLAHNANFDQWMLLNAGIDLNRRCPSNHYRVYDTMVMHALIDDQAPHDLKSLTHSYLDIEMVPFKKTFGHQMKTASLEEMFTDEDNHDVVLNYSSLDAYATYHLFMALRDQLQHRAVSRGPYRNMWEYYLKTELPFTKVLWGLERAGVLINKKALLDEAPKLEKKMNALSRWFGQQTGKLTINLDSNPALRELFFDQLKYEPLAFTDKTGAPKLDQAALKMWAANGCIYSKRLLAYRGLKKQLGTYITNLLKRVQRDGRIHTSFNQTGARCMPAGELMLTSKGYRPVEAIPAGLFTMSHTGAPREIVELTDYMVAPVYTTVLSNGLTLRTTGNHQYYTPDGWVRADALVPGQRVVVYNDPEEWRPIKKFEGFVVSSWGRIKSLATGTVLAPFPTGIYGHLTVTIQKTWYRTRQFTTNRIVCKLVAEAFGLDKNRVRHRNGIVWDNTIDNLYVYTDRDAPPEPTVFREASVVGVSVGVPERVFGVTVETDHSHVTGGVVTHNTGRLSCCAHWTPVTTQRGKIPIREVVVGDYVWTHMKRWRRVTAHWSNGVRDTLAFTLRGGQILTCTAAHRLLTNDGFWVRAGGYAHECIAGLDEGAGEPGGHPGSVQGPGEGADYYGDLQSVGGDGEDDSESAPRAYASSGTDGPTDTPVLSSKNRRSQPDVHKEESGQPQLGGGVRGWLRLPDVHTRGGAGVSAPSGDGTVERDRRGASAGEFSGAPYRRELEKQFLGQSGAGNEGGARSYSLFASEGLGGCVVEALDLGGCHEVFDISVDEDESYETCGVFSHNSSDPNLQNQTAQIRVAYVAQPGHRLMAADFAQLEMRILAHFSEDETLCAAIHNGEDVHCATAAKMFGGTYEEYAAAKHLDELPNEHADKRPPTDQEKVLLKRRKAAKTINFGIMYGQGPGKLALALGCSVDEARSIIDRYFKSMPGVTKYFETTIDVARVKGFCSTILGRQRLVPGILSPIRMDRAAAERQVRNSPIQGTAADITKCAMLRIAEHPVFITSGARMLLQVHDEIVFEVPTAAEHDKAFNDAIRECMTRPFDFTLAVPLDISMKYGDNWLEAK